MNKIADGLSKEGVKKRPVVSERVRAILDEKNKHKTKTESKPDEFEPHS
jgi:hypothetical protein